MPSLLKLCQLLLALLIINATINDDNVQAANILGLFAHSSESHFAVMRSVILELTRRQHNVTVYSTHRLNEQIENLKEIIVEPELHFWRELETNALGKQSNDLTKLATLSPESLQKALGAAGSTTVEQFLSNPAMVQLLQKPTSEFDYDLVIVDIFYTEALLALGYVHNTPTIGIVNSNFENYMQHVLDSIVPTGCSPNDFTTYTTATGYYKRLSNIRECIARRKQFINRNHAVQEKLIGKHFTQHFKNGLIPTVSQLQSHLSVLLLNNHVPLVNPQPLLLNTIFAGGLHIRAPRELPWHIRRFLDDSRIGVIYIHLGNEQQCANIPEERLKVLFECFGGRKEHVLWTCHDVQKLSNQPKNFMLQHMVAQTDILAHPHVKIFITNGDILAVQEGIMRHVPMIGIPLFRHEVHNTELAKRLGVMVQLDYNNVTTELLNSTVEHILDDPIYQHSIRQVAKIYRDRPLGALETCMYWVDYVLRTQGGALLKTHGIGIPSKQLHLFDLFVFYFAVTLIFAIIALGIGYAGYIFVWRHKQQKSLKMFSKLN